MTTTSGERSHISQPDRPKVFLSLQAGRGLAALMVVFYHCEGLLSIEKYWHWRRHYFYFGASGVDFFFVLSGIVILYAHQADIGRPQKLGDYAWKRFRRIYPIYWVILFTVIPVYLAVPAFGDGVQTEPAVILSSIVLLPFSRTETIVPVAWTLFHEIMFYLVFSLLLVRKTLGVVFFCIWMAASVVALFLPIDSASVSFYVSPLHLLFGLGLLIPSAVQRLNCNGLPIAILGFVSFVGCCILDDLVRPSSPYVPLTFGLFSAMVATGLMQMERAGRLRVPRVLIFLGDASYSLYLVHYLALSLTAKLLYPLWRLYPTPMIVPFSILICVALGAGLCLHVLVERPLLRHLPRPVRSSTNSSV